ncbi:hypothetical protein [Cohnella lupini]|uniref:Uncharacterized protein n=1 Tax=Cohnella lupini TaxID=1294267 RepID=A0A3D9HTQ5_9BACL|nr:hypothetical protein [Cohnella lupini]RED52805.1 hypothetical protein DFP95_1309 [Cohnella lupini]
MDNEVSNSIHIVVQVIVISVIIGILALFTTMSQSFGRGAAATIADTQAETYATELKNTADYGAVPSASVFVMLQKNANAIQSISGHAYGVTITKADDLTRLFDRKIRLTVIETNDLYSVTIGEK